METTDESYDVLSLIKKLVYVRRAKLNKHS